MKQQIIILIVKKNFFMVEIRSSKKQNAFRDRRWKRYEAR